MRPALPLALAFALAFAPLLAGCVAKKDDNGGLSTASVAPAAPDAHTLNMTAVSPTTTADAPATLDAPPQWREGEWWKVRVTDAFDHKSYEGTRVVAGQEDNFYLVGMPRDDFVNALMVLHIPGFGQVAKDDLAFEVHNCPFEPVKFPLKTGLTWQTKFECRDFSAETKVTSPTTADITMTNANEHMVLTYDATLHEISKIVFDNYATLEIVGHGYGYQGVVTVPHMFHLVFQQSRIGPLLGPGTTPMAPLESLKVDPTYDRVSFVLILGAAAPFLQPGAPDQAAGYYDEKVTGPDGKVYEATMLPSESGLKLAYFMADKPGGDWQFEHVVAGPGIAVAEGVAYHAYDVEVPSGRVLPSTGTHEHGS